MNLDALIFMPALAGSAIMGFVFLLFAAHYYLTILEGTAAGAKEISWQSEPVTDNFTKVLYLGWLLGVWAGPAYFIGRAVASGADAGWLKLAVPLLVMWVLYPVSQLSSLSASSIWVPMNLDVFARLAQKPAVTVAFFALTLPVFALFGVAFKWAFLTNGNWPMLFVGVPLVVFAGLLYARLLGRLAFALMFTKNLLKRKKKKQKPMDATPPASRDRPQAAAVETPDMTPIITPLDGELMGYNVLIAEDDPPAPKKRVKAQMADEPPTPAAKPQPAPRPAPARSLDPARTWTEEDDDATPYGMNPSEVKDDERVPEAVMKPRADEMALLDRRDAPKPPKVVWSLGLLAFLGQPGTLSALVILSGLGVFAGVMVRVARAFDPTVGGE